VSGVDSRTSQLGATEATGALALSQAEINGGLEFNGTLTINVIDGSDNGIDIAVDLSGITSFEDAVSTINSAIRNEAANDTTGAVSSAGLTAALRVDNQGGTSIVITGAFDAEFTADEGGTVTYTDADGAAVTDEPLFAAATASAAVNLNEINVSSRESAYQTIAAVDGALTQINTLRSELGAVQIRFESTISNLSVSVENLSAARSRIRDADFAAETAELTRAQILQQAGISVLAQANASPQSVLALLQ
jgi:flagellin